MTKTLVLIAVIACSKGDDKKPGAAADPWATPATPTTAAGDDDPWAAKAAPAESAQPAPGSADDPAPPPQVPQAEPQASGGATTLAGSYQCQQLRYGTSVNGMYRTAYVASALGVFEIDDDGAYRSASYPAKGVGRARANATTVTFEDGAYASSIGQAGTTSSGSFYIRFSENLTDAPAPSMRFNDHMCYRK